MRALLLATAAVLLSGPAAACDLGLMLGIDVSSSITAEQRSMVRRGTAGALRHPDVVAALSARGAVQISVFNWSDKQELVVPWTLVTEESLAGIAETIEFEQASIDRRGTSMRDAMRFAAAGFAQVECDAYVLDYLTDGQPNTSPKEARDALFRVEKHQINVLFVGQQKHAIERMKKEAQFGWSSFVMDIPDFTYVELGMIRKLRREIASVN